MRCTVLCFVFLCVEFAQLTDGLKSSDKGVCVTKHTVTKTRPKTVLVTVNKWCGKRRCVVKRTQQQKFSVTSNRLVCCSGFMYKAATDSCAPVCSTGCTNGTCISPNVCSCTPPTYLDPTTKNKCLTPTCDHPCINGQCSINNTCTCLKNFTTFNTTHCAPNCTEGFQIDSEMTCAPKCENCTNGRCTAPNTCTCNPGYKLAGACEPQCDPLCANGQCTAPDVCECNEGYAKVNGTCEPRCKEGCVNGRCVGPDVCACDDGFLMKNATVCLVSCKDCEGNSTCTLISSKTITETYTDHKMDCGKDGKSKCPETVTKTRIQTKAKLYCCPGFKLLKNGTCQPNCPYGCLGGKCVPPGKCHCETPLILINKNKCVRPVCDPPCLNGNCTAPNTCTCNEGYLLKEDNFTCAAQCTDCENGKCTAPNVCECNKGFAMIEKKCKPVCKNNCSNGFCSAPDVCSCNDGYKIRNNTCEPVCGVACVNANCVAPNACVCLAGFKPKDASKEVCEPKCDSCVNGDCIGPNKCSCHKGYALKDNVCTPICKDTCVNATCVGPNICECFNGFEPTSAKEVCRPKCDSCVNGNCEAPNKCSCHEGYALKDNVCRPICKDTCVNATCVGPNICECFNGFEPTSAKEVCRPKCDSCVNGDCIGPNKCSCHKGYALKDNVCTPICKDTCVNATCVGPNICECFNGFEPTSAKEVCRPKCDSCVNGNCEAPNKCSCHKGYALKDNVCRPICKDTCVNATCVGPNICECFIGFEPTSAKEVCRPKCDSCVNGNCEAPNKCSCHEGYALKDNVCRPICKDTCVNATCVGPNICECFIGFEPTAAKEVCRPKCDSCVNGDCVGPNKCSCHEGYTLKDNVCTVTCKDNCVNAKCVAPNKCECFAGFKPKNGHEAVCMPICDSCANGECVAPNKCVCRRGFTLIENVCRPTCEDECENGNCTAPNKCTCNDGYTKNLTKPSVCYKACDDCGMGSCSTNGTCICGADSELNNGTCVSLARVKASIESAQGLASLEVSWVVGGAVGILLVVLVVVVIQRTWRHQKDNGPKAADNGNTYGSVIYTLPDTLINNEAFTKHDGIDEEANESDEEGTNEKLLTQPIGTV